ncbi:hypothetical protein UA08_00769 [Talaromyces atroroseus]|uniref:Uncharacterized protein n=1 Tax=Talaromyces atroroseus TaxID=1441469 RepID=A0A225ATW9_TALAT|nr:hypothetical protein UA08_00769 [Talaromyces atroroseus]OKL64380.1 hypothetical protein UA08_00769 [Talaromyces atroroseus]
MPAPLAKGIIVGVSVLVAAGIAVYESPQFRRWVDQSRRKIAIALYNLGDEIHPREPVSQDISMTEEASEAAMERRRQAREEIALRRELMQSRRDTRTSSAAVSFDALVDQDGRLRSGAEEGDVTRGIVDEKDDITTAHSTALDSSRSTWLHKRGGGSPEPEALTDARLQAQREMMEAIERDRLHLYLPSETPSHHPSESLIDLTPTSEFPELTPSPSKQDRIANSEYFSIASLPSSTHNDSDIGQSGFFYAHPNQSEDRSSAESTHPEADPFQDHDLSAASSVAGSLEHVHHDVSSDGTLSEWGQHTDGALTPASWSEVGSVISSDDEHHHQ